MVSFLEYLMFFRGVFCTELHEITWRMDLIWFLEFTVFFDIKWRFRQGNRLCVMADFQNGLISRILSVFSSGVLHRTTRIHLENKFWHDFWNSNFLEVIWNSNFLEYWVFFRAVFCAGLLEITWRMDFDMICWSLIFDPNWRFSKGYRLCTMADFENGLISRIFGVFSCVFFSQKFIF